MAHGVGLAVRSAAGDSRADVEFFQRAGEAMEQKLLPWEVFTAVIFVLGSALIYGGTAMAYRAVEGSDLRLPRGE